MISDEIKWDIGIFDPEGKNNNPLNGKPYSDSYKSLAKFWSNLPAYKDAKYVTQVLNENQVILVKSGTGSGKSVIINKLCLHLNDYKGKIIMTLPKKVITKSAAEFAAKMMDVELGNEIGYMYRGETVKTNKTVLLYSTDGSIISMIKNDPALKEVDMMIIDELHERKVNIDLLLYLLRNAISIREKEKFKPLKLILMSATINEEIFQKYFSDFRFKSLELAGTPNHPIQSFYLDTGLNIGANEYINKGIEIIGNIINKINNNTNNNDANFIEGDILFFVCTVSECDLIAEKLSSKHPDCFTMGLYSGFNQELEQYVGNPEKFKELNPNFKRRLFISTNVAESSLTIDGIVYVVDSGLELNVKFEPSLNTNIMTKKFITQAQMTQRKGRAGRTKPGICFHLYTEAEQENAVKFPEPEIKCIDIKNTCISLLKMCTDINKKCSVKDTIQMFTDFIEPPGEQYIANGFDFAFSNGLIDSDNHLSKIGKLIVDSKLDVMDGLSMLYAWNISHKVFKAVFKIISLYSFLKSGIDELFFDDLNENIKNNVINNLLKKSFNSEHVLLYNLYDYISTNGGKGIFKSKFFENIKHAYNRQIEKLKRIYKEYDIKIDSVSPNTAQKEDFEISIIKSFCFGYKSNIAFKSSTGFKYNNKVVDLTKSRVKFDASVSSIIFYANLYWSGKLSLMICSPNLLK